MNYEEAKKLLENGEAERVIDYFKSNNHQLEYGYACLLTGDLARAESILSPLTSARAEWGYKIIPFLKGEHGEFPSFFQIRNFLELDITLFFKYGQIEFIQNILNIADFFQDINRETYKFLGRVLFKHGYYGAAKTFMDKSLSDYYNDVELHYLYVEFYLAHNDKENALKAVNTCLRLNPNYYPAVKTSKALV